jgi:hypothetical protein
VRGLWGAASSTRPAIADLRMSDASFKYCGASERDWLGHSQGTVSLLTKDCASAFH